MKNNTRYEILTPDGWKDFTGVAYTGEKETLTLTLSDGKSVTATPEHKFVKDGETITTDSIEVGDRLDTLDGTVSVINILKNADLRDCFDIVDVHHDDHQYIIENSLISNNCDELAFVSKRIALNFWTSVFPTLSCLTGDTWVLSDQGYRQIKSYFTVDHKAGDYFVLEGEKTWGMSGIEDISHGYVSPASKTFIIETRSGHRVEVTEDHPLFTLTDHKGSMVKARDLTVGGYLRIDIGMNVFGNATLDDHVAYQLGTMGNGFDDVMQKDRNTVTHFLSGLFSSVGKVSGRGIELCLNPERVQQVKLLLNNLGYVSSVEKDEDNSVLIIDLSFAQKFQTDMVLSDNMKTLLGQYADTVSQDASQHFWYPVESVRAHIEERVAQSTLKPTSPFLTLSECVTHEWIEFVKEEGIDLDIATGGFVWDDIVSIQESYQDVTYDFTVPVTHSFLQNGILGSNTGGSCIITSTPTDDETLFADIWKKANDRLDEFGNETKVGSNGFSALKVKWDEHPDRGPEFKDLMVKQFGEEKFRREHELDFIPEDETLISPLVLSELKASDPIQKTGEIRWYKELDREKIYLIGYDPSLGTGGDNSAIQIVEFPTLEQVGEWMHNRSDIPTQLNVLKRILNMFKNAGFDEDNVRWTLENNSIGEAPLVLIDEYGEDEFFGYFMSEPYNPLDAKRRRRFRKGYNTNASSKLTACTRMKRWIEQGTMTIHSRALIRELKGFVSRGRTYKARAGDKDDLVMSLMVVVRMAMATMDEDDDYMDALGVGADMDEDDLDDWDQPLPVIF